MVKTIIINILVVYALLRLLYVVVGISYEWIAKKKVKGFTLNVIASVILYVLWFTIPYQIFLKFRKRKVGSVLDELVLHEYDKAASRDQTGNVVHSVILNKFLISPNGYKFGDKDETVSGVLGVNEILHYIEEKPLGVWLTKTLNDIETGHCFISIDEGDIRWSALSDRDKILLKAKLDGTNF